MEGREENGKIYGRGSVDMKSAIAVYVMLMIYFAKQKQKPSLGLIFTSDEEIGGEEGAGYLRKKGIGLETEIFFTGEPFRGIAYASKGRFCFQYTNSLHNIFQFYKRINLLYDFNISDEKTTLSPTVLRSGKMNSTVVTNKIPSLLKTKLISKNFEEIDKFIEGKKYITREERTLTFKGEGGHSAHPSNIINPIIEFMHFYERFGKNYLPCDQQYTAVFDIRFDEHFQDHKLSVLKQNAILSGAKILHEYSYTGSRDHLSNKRVLLLKKIYEKYTQEPLTFFVANGSSDLRWFADLKKPSLSFGTAGKNYHGKNEYVFIKSLDTMYQIMKKFIENLV